MPPFDVMEMVYDPITIGQMTMRYLERIQRLKDDTGYAGVPVCLPSIDDVLLPGLPGEIRAVLGRPGSGKTSFSWATNKAWAEVIRQSNRRAATVYATIEQIAEQLNASHAAAAVGISIDDLRRGRLAPEALEKLRRFNATERAALPMFLIGYSSAKRGMTVDLTIDMVGEAVARIEDEFDVKVEEVTVDYLQLMKASKALASRQAENRVIVVGDNFARGKRLAASTDAFWVVNSQATRDVDDRDKFPVPEQGDGMWSSAIEQDADSGISVVRPIKYFGKDKFMAFLAEKFKVNTSDPQAVRDLMLVYIWKQREGDTNVSRLVRYDPRFRLLDDLDLKYAAK